MDLIKHNLFIRDLLRICCMLYTMQALWEVGSWVKHGSPRVTSWLSPSPLAPEPTFSFNVQVTCLALAFHLQLEFQVLPNPPCSVPGNFAVIFLSIQFIISSEVLISTFIDLPLYLWCHPAHITSLPLQCPKKHGYKTIGLIDFYCWVEIRSDRSAEKGNLKWSRSHHCAVSFASPASGTFSSASHSVPRGCSHCHRFDKELSFFPSPFF